MKNQVNKKQYLTFDLDDVNYAIEFTRVKEMVQLLEPTSLPDNVFSTIECYGEDCIDEGMVVLG